MQPQLLEPFGSFTELMSSCALYRGEVSNYRVLSYHRSPSTCRARIKDQLYVLMFWRDLRGPWSLRPDMAWSWISPAGSGCIVPCAYYSPRQYVRACPTIFECRRLPASSQQLSFVVLFILIRSVIRMRGWLLSLSLSHSHVSYIPLPNSIFSLTNRAGLSFNAYSSR